VQGSKTAETEASDTYTSHTLDLPYSTQGWAFVGACLRGKVVGIQDFRVGRTCVIKYERWESVAFNIRAVSPV
jgi:hypothetical protein